jgi:hypothetical protein
VASLRCLLALGNRYKIPIKHVGGGYMWSSRDSVDSDRVIVQRLPTEQLRMVMACSSFRVCRACRCSITKRMLSLAESADWLSLRPGASAVLSADDADPGLLFGAIPRNKYSDNEKSTSNKCAWRRFQRDGLMPTKPSA